MAIDVESFKPCLGNVMGGLSGPVIKPIVLRHVYQCARAVSLPISPPCITADKRPT